MYVPRVRSLLSGIGAAVLSAAAVTAAAAPASASAEPRAPLPPPPSCATGCEQVFNVRAAYNVRFVAWQDADVPSSRNALVYYYDGRIHHAVQLEDKGPVAASCGRDGDAARCAVTYFTGAHSMGAMSVLLTWNDGILRTDDVLGGAPGARLVQLDGNGRTDVALRESTYVPDYAEAPQYWKTYLEFDGKFVLTGCTPPTQDSTPVPDSPAYGSCGLP